jgi:butyryl-CoA dehydrogenase
LKFGSAEQKAHILPPVARGEKLGCFGLTEPMSGSDAQTMATSAEKTSGGWVINGAKNWITNGPHADWILVFAVTERAAVGPEPDARPKLKHTAFLVERGTPGFAHASPDHKLGIHAAHSCTVFFENCKVGDDRVLGAVGDGFKIAMATLDGGRIGIACQAIGIARAAFERSVEYAKERKSFGVPIAQHQAIQFMLADMATQIDAARLLAWRAATMKDEGARHTTESAIAKLYASEMATRVTHKAIQIHGGYGYSAEFPLERHYRDARITEIYEGTSEIQRLVIAASLLR